MNPSPFAMAKINMFLHFLEDAVIEKGDVLADPKFTEKGALQQFDYVVANPPYSVDMWDRDAFQANKHGVLSGYTMPPEKTRTTHSSCISLPQ